MEFNEMENPPLLLLREPYLQNNFADSVTVVWKTTDAATSGYLEYIDIKNQSVRINANIEHQNVNTLSYVTVKKLSPNHRYYYKVYNNGQLMSDSKNNHFESAQSYRDKFSFLATGDIGQPPSWNGHCKETVNEMLKLESKPNFILGLGDLVYPEGSSLEADRNFFKPFAEILPCTPMYSVLGNHDHKSDIEQNFKQEWILPGNEQYYSFDYANAHFIGLDSGDDFGFSNCKDQMAWFEEDLKCAQGKYDWIILYLHHHGKTCTYKKDENDVLRIYSLLSKYNVDLVLNGHIHQYERLKPLDSLGVVIPEYANHEFVYPEMRNGFISVTAGTGGRVSHSKPENDMSECRKNKVVRFLEELSFVQVSIDKKVLNFNLVSSEDGSILDHFKIDKNL